MKCYSDIKLKTYDGQPLILDGKAMTLLDAMTLATTSTLVTDESMTGADKLALYKLAIKLATAEESHSLTVEETTIVLSRAEKLFTPLLYGQVVKHLDPAKFSS